jgi:hypothetical protein
MKRVQKAKETCRIFICSKQPSQNRVNIGVKKGVYKTDFSLHSRRRGKRTGRARLSQRGFTIVSVVRLNNFIMYQPSRVSTRVNDVLVMNEL